MDERPNQEPGCLANRRAEGSAEWTETPPRSERRRLIYELQLISSVLVLPRWTRLVPQGFGGGATVSGRNRTSGGGRHCFITPDLKEVPADPAEEEQSEENPAAPIA
ncbi:hypothetical protein EYF80_051960 [Liparis tanakae]|uniref:Uncharacterized protein n=1 Tax=Liparis tanakae TaxID=230148 RepID=A0A4Z2F9M5_9TELE|nr:hypothetical protein EYF80_051960 [Liparis tanakae]